MTTAHSPLRELRGQADAMARLLKAIDRGEDVGVNDPAGKIAASRAAGRVKFGIVMDDKLLSIEMDWSTVRSASEAGISALILRHMREQRVH